MITYENYALPCPLLRTGDSTDPVSFIRSDFEYEPRQRSVYRGLVRSGFSVIVKHDKLNAWKQFWKDIHYGADAFKSDFLVHGDDNVGKTLRFVTSYALKPLGNKLYQVSSEFEVLDDGTPKADSCPLYPYELLYPGDTLYPCG